MPALALCGLTEEVEFHLQVIYRYPDHSEVLNMVKSKWASALVGVLLVSVLSIDAARGDNTCKDYESRISDLEKRVAELEEIIIRTPTPPVQIKACDDGSVDLRSVAVGFKCHTSTGAIFERVSRDGFGEAWKGPDDLIWSDFVGEDSQYDAVTTCKNLGGRLPSRADFERGETNGFREVLPNMKDRWFWSSTVISRHSAFAYGFNGDNGYVGYAARSLSDRSVRCAGL